MIEAYTDQPLPADVRELIETPPVPFEDLKPYQVGPEGNVYELGLRSGEGNNYQVHQYMRKLGSDVVLLTQIETSDGSLLFDIDTPHEKALDRLHHPFPSAPKEELAGLFPKRAA